MTHAKPNRKVYVFSSHTCEVEVRFGEEGVHFMFYKLEGLRSWLVPNDPCLAQEDERLVFKLAADVFLIRLLWSVGCGLPQQKKNMNKQMKT
eukprot:4141487-Amphidinium_carterae.1